MAARAASIVAELQHLQDRLKDLAADDTDGIFDIMNELWVVMDRMTQQVHPLMLIKYNLSWNGMQDDLAAEVLERLTQAFSLTIG
jgi:hypothetical protein